VTKEQSINTKDKLDFAVQGISISEKGFNEIISQFLVYFKKCGFVEGDFRHYHLSMLLQTLIYTKFQRDVFLEEVNNDNKKIEIYLKGLGDRNLHGFLHQFDLLNRANFATLFNFQFEIITKEILKEMKINFTDDYYSCVKSLLEEIYPNVEERTKKRRTLMTMAQIRNSLHQSGIHTSKYEFEIELDKIKFKFETGKKINQTSWGHLLIIAKSMLEILIEIFSSKKIQNIPFVAKKRIK
jgi:hypothetical protein